MWSSGSGAHQRASASLTVTARMRPSSRDAPVQLAQERPAVAVVVFPGVLAIQDDGHQGVAAGAENAGAVLADAAQEILRGGGGVHLGIDEADQVAQEVIAEDHAAAARPPCRQR